jgi:hypothetical protein
MQTHLPNTKEAVFSAWSVQSAYKEDFSREVVVESSFETPACHDMSLVAEKLN